MKSDLDWLDEILQKAFHADTHAVSNCHNARLTLKNEFGTKGKKVIWQCSECAKPAPNEQNWHMDYSVDEREAKRAISAKIKEIELRARVDELNILASFYPPKNKFNQNLNIFIESLILDLQLKTQKDTIDE